MVNILSAGGQSIMIKSYFSFTLLTSSLRMYSLLSTPINSISAAERSIFDGRTSRFSITSSYIHSSIPIFPIIRSYTVFSTSFLSTPRPLDIFPCGSISIANTFFPRLANDADKLIAVVVFPTPPF